MIRFNDWVIEPLDFVVHQFDHLSRRLEVKGNLPENWSWSMLVQTDNFLDIIALEPIEGGVGRILSKDQLSLSGYYTMQLRGMLGEAVRHTNVIQVFVPKSLSGTGQWPTVPSEFLEIEQHINELYRHPPVPGENGFWLLWSPSLGLYEPSPFPLSSGILPAPKPGDEGSVLVVTPDLTFVLKHLEHAEGVDY